MQVARKIFKELPNIFCEKLLGRLTAIGKNIISINWKVSLQFFSLWLSDIYYDDGRKPGQSSWTRERKAIARPKNGIRFFGGQRKIRCLEDIHTWI